MKCSVLRGVGLLALATGAVALGCKSKDEDVGTAVAAINSADLTVTVDAGNTDLDCSADPIIACFDVETNGQNITHIFIDVKADCAPDEDDFHVYLGVPGTSGAELVTHLHDNGGPCRDLLSDDRVWFPLIQNQSEQKVCIVFDGFVPEKVELGAKSQNECVSEAILDTCDDCKEKPPCDECDRCDQCERCDDYDVCEVPVDRRCDPSCR